MINELGRVIGITGEVGSGKSTVCTFLKGYQKKVISADEVVHKLYDNQDIIDKIAIIFPSAVVNNVVNRRILSDIVYSPLPTALKLLNLVMKKYIRPALEEAIKEAIEADVAYKDFCFWDATAQSSNIVFVEMPLLFELGFEDMVDISVAVHCSNEDRFTALIDKIGNQKAYAIAGAQLDSLTKVALCDYVIRNDGTEDDLFKEVKKFLKRLEI